MQKVHCLYYILNTIALYTFKFRLYFTTFGSFHLSFTVLIHYRLIKIFKIRRWFSFFQTKLYILYFTFFFYKLQITGLSPYCTKEFRLYSVFIYKKIIFLYFYSAFIHHYLQNLFLIYIPLVTKMFQFTKFFFLVSLKTIIFYKVNIS